MATNRTRKVTLSDVAEKAGVSRTTASYILGKTRGGFSQETVERVSSAAKELGFSPNPIAQSLRTGRTSLLGLLMLPDPRSPQDYIRSQIEVGIAIEARKHQMDVVQVLVPPEPGSDIARVSELLGTGLVEGLIVIDFRNRPILSWLRDYGAAFVVIGSPDISSVPSVDADNVRLGRATAQHLLDLGHTHLLYIAPLRDLTYGNERVEAFLAACKDNNIPSGQVTVLRSEDSMAGGYKAIKEAVRNAVDFTAVCASDDSIAYGAVTAIRELGLCVPEDVSVVGCNNDYLSGIDQDFLTTVELDFVQLGTLAANKLICMLDDQPTPRRELIDFRLLPRKSSGPASAASSNVAPTEMGDGDTAVRI